MIRSFHHRFYEPKILTGNMLYRIGLGAEDGPLGKAKSFQSVGADRSFEFGKNTIRELVVRTRANLGHALPRSGSS